jgi:autophagy-related protein 17
MHLKTQFGNQEYALNIFNHPLTNTFMQETQTSFDSSILSFDDDLRALKTAMTAAPILSNSRSHASLSASPIPENLQALETHAQEMASLLDSLVSHFDLCVNAIRHTEGGFAAVRKAASDLPPGAEPVSVSGVMSTSQNQDQGEDEPPTEEERLEMLTVLENDASQVDDVIVELRERLVEMESRFEVIRDHVENLTATYTTTTTALSILESISAHLPGYLMASSDFRLHWDETKMQIQDQLQELESMRLFYENYHASYDGLILEVYRRTQSEEKVKIIMKKAMEQIEKVVEADMRERESFRGDVGDFLPGDLWGGVAEAAPRWEFKRVGEFQGDGTKSSIEILAPELERGVVEAAGRRDRERQRLQR